MSLHERAAGPVEEERERHAAARIPEPPAPASTATLLALQRSAGNQQVARALAARRTIQRMSVLKTTDDGRELVAFEDKEPLPETQPFDGYEYEKAGSGDGRTFYKRRLISYQSTPSPKTPPSSGGPVTPSASKYFPQQATIDYGAYSVGKGTQTLTQLLEQGFTGYARMIDTSDVESLADELQLGVQKLVTQVGESVSAMGASIVSTMRGLVSGGEGTTVMEERLVREKLLKQVDDPRVIHYLLLHSRGDLSRSGISFVVSKLTGGLSATVEKSGSAVSVAGLGTELGLVAKGLADENAEKKQKAHSADEVEKLVPSELIEAIGSLAIHYGGSSVVEGLKAIPFYVGTVVALLQTGARKIGGTTEDAQRACIAIRDHARRGEAGALKVIQLLGVPEEVALAQGGEKAMIIRL